MKLKLIVGISLIIFAANAANDDDQSRKRQDRPSPYELLGRAAKRHETRIATGSLDVFEDTLQDNPQPVGLSACLSSSSSSSSLSDKAPVTMLKVLETLASRGILNVRVDTLSILLLGSVDVGEIDLVKFLLSQGADIEAKNSIGATPLIWACFKNHLEIVKCLLEAGADTEAKDKQGRRGLRFASQMGHTKIVKHLVGAHGVQIYPADMQIAAEFQKKKVLAYLMHKSGKYDNTLECAICFEPNAVYTSSCCFGGEYCTSCADVLAKNETSCPTCRSKGLKTKLIDIKKTMAQYVPEAPVAQAACSSMQPSCSSSDMHA